MMKSMLQELDSNLITKENFIHDQRGKLGEKDKIIQNQKAEMERLEKKAKMLEYKVKTSHPVSQPLDCYSVLQLTCL